MKLPRKLTSRFSLDPEPKQVERGLRLDGLTLFLDGRWLADFQDKGAAQAGLEVERRRLAQRRGES